MRYQSSHKRHQHKASRLHVIASPVVFPFVFCTICSVGFLDQGELAPESNNYESWYYSVVVPRFVCLVLLARSSLY